MKSDYRFVSAPALFVVLATLTLLAAPVRALPIAFSATAAGTTEFFTADTDSSSTGAAVSSSHSFGGQDAGFSGSSSASASVVVQGLFVNEPDVRLRASAVFSGDPVIGAFAGAIGEWHDVVTMVVTSQLPPIAFLLTTGLIDITGGVTGSGDVTFSGQVTYGGSSFTSRDQPDLFQGNHVLRQPEVRVVGLEPIGGLPLLYIFDLDFTASISVIAGIGALGIPGKGTIDADFSESSFTLLGFDVTDVNGNFIPVSIQSANGFSYRQLNGPGRPPNGAPEPTTIALLGLGLAGLGFSRRRKSH